MTVGRNLRLCDLNLFIDDGAEEEEWGRGLVSPSSHPPHAKLGKMFCCPCVLSRSTLSTPDAFLCRRGAGEREARWARWEEGLEKRGMCQYGGCGSVEFCYPLLNLTTKSPHPGILDVVFRLSCVNVNFSM